MSAVFYRKTVCTFTSRGPPGRTIPVGTIAAQAIRMKGEFVMNKNGLWFVVAAVLAVGIGVHPVAAQLSGCITSQPTSSTGTIVYSQKPIAKGCMTLSSSSGLVTASFTCFSCSKPDFTGNTVGSGDAFLTCANGYDAVQVGCNSGPCSYCWQFERQ